MGQWRDASQQTGAAKASDTDGAVERCVQTDGGSQGGGAGRYTSVLSRAARQYVHLYKMKHISGSECAYTPLHVATIVATCKGGTLF